jgi:hypothetical protein
MSTRFSSSMVAVLFLATVSAQFPSLMAQMSIEALIRDSYQRELGESVPRPAIFNDEPFITSPILFGWEDVDGDGVPEILDDTPYGRAR